MQKNFSPDFLSKLNFEKEQSLKNKKWDLFRQFLLLGEQKK
jgi:hypothetical protein